MDLNLDLPTNFNKYSVETQKKVIEYLSQLDTVDKQAYSIAKVHLGSSFNIVKSNGYNDWLNQK